MQRSASEFCVKCSALLFALPWSQRAKRQAAADALWVAVGCALALFSSGAAFRRPLSNSHSSIDSPFASLTALGDKPGMKAPTTVSKIGRYEVLTRLQSGGMADVYLGFTRGPGGFRKYAVMKRIVPSAATDENFVKMFLDEARITAAFSHQNIAQVFELGEDDEGLFVVMEFIAGANLNEIVAACAAQKAVLPLGFSVSSVHDCALALHYAHTYRTPSGSTASVIHRDVAQKNIMVAWDGQVKLLDFGIAKAKNTLSHTHVGTVKGTAGYMSPEQVKGEALDGRSDVFSLGVVLWEMSTGRRLFSSDSELTEMKMILEAPIPLASTLESTVPKALGEVIDQALKRDKRQRFASARDFAKSLSHEHGGFFFDSEERAHFMAERFQERILSSQQLFEAADQRSEIVLTAVAQYVADRQEERSTPLQSVAINKPSRYPFEKPKTKTDPEISLALLRAEAEVLGQMPQRRFPFGLAAVLAAIAVLGVSLSMWMSKQETAPGIQKFDEAHPLEASESDLKLNGADNNPMVPIAPMPDAKSEPAAEVPAKKAAEPRTKAPNKKQDNAKSDNVKGVSEVSLILLPSGAAVFEGKQELGKSTLLQLNLSVGIHRLVLVGPDGRRHRLSLAVKSGKNMPVKVNVDELPGD